MAFFNSASMHILQLKLYRSSFHEILLNNGDDVRRCRRDFGRSRFLWFLNDGGGCRRIRRVDGTSNFVTFYWKMLMMVEVVEEMVVEVISLDFIEYWWW